MVNPGSGHATGQRPDTFCPAGRSRAAWFRVVPVIGLLGLLSVAGCATRQPPIAQQLGADFRTTELQETVFFAQDAYQCGPAALATILQSSGVNVLPDDLVPQIYLPERHGSLQLELLSATRRHGRMAYLLSPDFPSLAAQIASGRPVLVLQNVGFRRFPVWHYAVVIGIDPLRDEIILRSGTHRRLVMDAGEFLETWARGQHWAMLSLVPGEMPAQADTARYLQAALDLEAVGRHADALAAYRAAAARWPESQVAAIGVASALYGLGQLQAAEAAYRTVLQHWPDQVVALNNLGLLLGEQGCPAAGLELVDRAIRISGASLRPALLGTREEILALPASRAESHAENHDGPCISLRAGQ